MDIYSAYAGICSASAKIRYKLSHLRANGEIKQLAAAAAGVFASGQRTTATAHSGALATRDNTLYSVKVILKSRADILEMDLTFRPDGTPVIIHSEKPSAKAGTEFSKILDAVDSNSTILLNLDLKNFDGRFLPTVQTMLEAHSLTSRAFFTGVYEENTAVVSQSCPKIPYWLNCSLDPGDDYSRRAQMLAEKISSLGAAGANISYKYSSAELARALHNKGLGMSVWTVNSLKGMYKALADGADNITSRVPLVLIEVLNALGR